MMIASEAMTSITSGLVDAAHAVVDHVDGDALLRQLSDLVGQRLEQAGHVRLEDQGQLDRATPGARHHVLSETLTPARRAAPRS